ncbi:MAG: 50S ribosomal protein L3 N(5)-glutamine methyltransferase [Gammaproteobacteria bacterium]
MNNNLVEHDELHMLKTINDYVRWGASQFNLANLHYGHGTDNALDEALALVLHNLHLSHDIPEHMLYSRLTMSERRSIMALLKQRIECQIPAAYLIKQSYFAGISFYVDERVLIPRSPLAETIEQHWEPWLVNVKEPHILDLCCGSGCIAIATALYCTEAQVDAVDISDEALAVAEINVKRHGLDQRVHLVKSDLFEALPRKEYDLIVSNPPYVPQAEYAQLPKEFSYEPKIALLAKQKGLAIVYRILLQAADYLTDEGTLIVEVGNSEATLSHELPDLPLLWLDFERGGKGVFAINKHNLLRHRKTLQEKLRATPSNKITK